MLWPAEKLLPVTGTEQQKKNTKQVKYKQTGIYIFRGITKYFLLKVQTLWSLTSSF